MNQSSPLLATGQRWAALCLAVILMTGAGMPFASPSRAAGDPPPLPPVMPPSFGGRGEGHAAPTPSLPLTAQDDWWGVQLYGTNLQVGHMQQLGAGWVRVPLKWNTIEPVNTTPENYQWPAAFDAQLAQLSASNTQVLLTLMGNPSWAATYEAGPIDKAPIGELVQFMEAAVAHYGGPPYNVKHWEIYNEPDNYNTENAEYGGHGYFGHQPEKYVEILAALYDPIKAVDAEAQIVFGGLAYDRWGIDFEEDFLDDVLALDGDLYFDVMNFHYFYYYHDNWDPYGIDIIGKTNYIRDKLAEFGVNKPLVCTEACRSSNLKGGDKEEQSRYVPKVFTRSREAGLDFAVWWWLFDVSNNPMVCGLLDEAGQPNPAYYAYQTLARELSSTVYVGSMPPAETGSTKIEAYEFEAVADSSTIIVAWTTDDSTRSMTLETGQVVVVSKEGSESVVYDGDDGAVDGEVTVTLTGSPVYLRPYQVMHMLPAGLTLLAPNVQTHPPTTAAAALAEIGSQGGDVSAICRWRSQQDIWECHQNGYPFNDFDLELGQGYAFLMDASGAWRRRGTPPSEPVPVQLNPIWTLVGLPKLPGPLTAENLLQQATAQGGDCTEIYRWYQGGWQGHLRGQSSNNFALAEDEGYFVRCAQSTTYIPEQALPGSFGKISPLDGATAQPADPTLAWNTSSGATSYEYCIDAVDNDVCDPGWADVGNSTSENLAGLSDATVYYWQVRARNTAGTTEADGQTWWSFRTLDVGPLEVDGYTVDDDGADDSAGNGDGMADCGETLEIFVDLRNLGADPATGVVATLSTSDPHVTLLANTASSYPAIPGGGTAANDDDFELAVDPSTPHGHVVHFDLDIAAAYGGPWSDGFDMPVTCRSVHDLPVGWNLLAPNLETDPPADAETALDQIRPEGAASEIYRWLSDSDRWEGHTQGQPYGSFMLELGQGYFLRADAASTWTREGWKPAEVVPVEMNPIWTLIGLPVLPAPMTAADLLSDANAQGGACTQVARWDNPIADWKIHTPSLPASDFALTDNQGYFVECAQAFTYTPGGGSAKHLPSSWPPPVEPETLKPVADPTISDVLVTNRRDVAFGVTWRTDQPSNGWIEYGETDQLGHSTSEDAAASQAHQVMLTGLTPETAYYFRIHSGETVDDNGGELYQATTKATVLPPVPYLAYGPVETADGKPAVGALVRGRVVDNGVESEPLSTLVDGYGYWSLNLPLQSCEGVELKLQVLGRRGSEAALTQSVCDVRPAPAVVLSEEGANQIFLPMILRQP